MRFAGSMEDQSSSAAMRRLSRYDSSADADVDAFAPAAPRPPPFCCARGSPGRDALETPSALAPNASASERKPLSCTFDVRCCDALDSAQVNGCTE